MKTLQQYSGRVDGVSVDELPLGGFRDDEELPPGGFRGDPYLFVPEIECQTKRRDAA